MIKNIANNLIAVGKAPHSAHDSEDIVVSCVYTYFRSDGGFWSKLELESCVIDTGEIASSGWLMFFWFEGKGVYVDTSCWNVGVMLVWLYQVEV